MSLCHPLCLEDQIQHRAPSCRAIPDTCRPPSPECSGPAAPLSLRGIYYGQPPPLEIFFNSSPLLAVIRAYRKQDKDIFPLILLLPYFLPFFPPLVSYLIFSSLFSFSPILPSKFFPVFIFILQKRLEYVSLPWSHSARGRA